MRKLAGVGVVCVKDGNQFRQREPPRKRQSPLAHVTRRKSSNIPSAPAPFAVERILSSYTNLPTSFSAQTRWSGKPGQSKLVIVA